MLEELQLSAVGGIDRATLHFSSGLTAVTGESGAGKSSLVRGLEMILGKRASISSIHSGDSTAVTDAFFYVDSPLPDLDEALQPADASFALRREFSRNGRGKCSIQGQTVPLNTLCEVAPRLIAIQSQFAQLELLDPELQMSILDACGGKKLKETAAELELYFYKVIDCEKQVRLAKAHEKEVLKKYSSYNEVAPFLEKLSQEAETEEVLNEEYEATERAVKRLKDLRSFVRMLSNPEAGGLVSEVSQVFEGITRSLPEDNREELTDASQQLLGEFESLCDRLAALAPLEKIDILEENLDDVERRLGLLRKCKRLAKVSTLAELLEYRSEGAEAMKWLKGSSRELAALNDQVTETKRLVAQKARELHHLRVDAARQLEERVTRNLSDLAMDTTCFRINVIETNKVRATGAEKVEFVLVRGTDEIPVDRAASGGELSRILLAIRLSLPDHLMPPTVVFDEVEAGLGGRSAYLTGLKLRELADRVQVILITHEASIAALADRQFHVERKNDVSTISIVEGEDRVREIARMLSGDEKETEALNHAAKLLEPKSGAVEDAIVFNPENI